jgi:hypothetical protein
MSTTILTPNLNPTENAYSVGMAETFSWIPVESSTERPLFARASYITNLKDLSVNFSASNITIPGGIELADGVDSNIKATVITLGPNQGTALKVITQDLESTQDDVSIGDRDGNLAEVDSELKALKVVALKKTGSYNSFNNTNKWVADATLRPLFSIKRSSITNGAPLKLADYQIKCDAGLLIYEWFEGDINIGGTPGAPGWSSVGSYNLYRTYQNTNTFTQGTAVLRHSGIINSYSANLFNPLTENGALNTNTWTLCIKHVDNSNTDVFFAVTLEELA